METNINDKYVRLLDEEDEFQIKKEELIKLTNPENIKSQISYDYLMNLGGLIGLFIKLYINPSEGLNDQDKNAIKRRLKKFGSNELPPPYAKNFLDCFLEALNQKVFIILIFAASLNLVINLWKENGKWFDFMSIYIAVFILCLSMSIIDYYKERVFRDFQSEIQIKNVRVLRNFEEKLIPQNELLVGDLLLISTGEMIPVDGIIIKTYSITIDGDESLFCYNNIDHSKQKFGSEDIDKTEFPFVLSGSYVIKGCATMLVLNIGREIHLHREREQIEFNNSNNNIDDIESDGDLENEEKEFILEGQIQTPKNNNRKFKWGNYSKKLNNYISIDSNNNRNKNLIQFEEGKDEREYNNITNNNNDKNNKSPIINRITNYVKRNNIKNNIPSFNNKENSLSRNKSIEFNLRKSSSVNVLPNTQNFEKTIDNDNYLSEKDIVDYAEEFNQFTQTKKNIEIKSGAYRNKSMTSFSFFKKKEIYNVRSKDKRRTNTDFFYYSPLKNKIQKIEHKLSKFGLIMSLISGLSYILVYFLYEHRVFNISEFLSISIDAFIYGIVLIVLAVPEGLPFASILSAAFSINKMREEHTIIKSIQACENLATINCICTDFNSIFTKNDMKISKIFAENNLLDSKQIKDIRSEISQASFDFLCEGISINTIAYSAKNENEIEEGNINGKVENNIKNNSYNFQQEFFGDTIETSLLKFLYDIKVNYKDFRSNKKRQIIGYSPPSFDFKISYTIIEMDAKHEFVRMYLRGNLEYIIDNLNNYITNQETLERIDPKFKQKIKNFCRDSTIEGEHPILFCYRDISKEHFFKMRNVYLNKPSELVKCLTTQLNLIAIICMKDEIKENVKSYVEICNKAGIAIKMITSLDKDISKITAEKCGILNQKKIFSNDLDCSFDSSNSHHEIEYDGSFNNNYIINHNKNDDNTSYNINEENKIRKKFSNNYSLNGNGNININGDLDIIDCYEDLQKLIDMKLKKKNININYSYHSFEFLVNDINKFEKVIQNSKVICKATSKDKYILISTLKKNGYVVAITGDSVSDYLAMRSAQVSISMGLKATDMSKESADMILNDNSFENILTGIIYGRNIYSSVKKFIQFQMTASISILSFVCISSLPFIDFYFYPNQILWLNFILDTFGSIALSSERPNRDEILSRKPYSNKKNLISRTMKIRIFVQAFFQMIIVIIMVFAAPSLLKIESDRGLNFLEWKEANGFHTTIVFLIFAYMQFFNAFISRNLDKKNLNIFKNVFEHKVFLSLQIICLICNYLLINYGDKIIKSKPLNLLNHIYCFLISSLVLISVPIVKMMASNKKIKEYFSD
jgi:magnesium-transporting ATPase (P-type)